MLAQAAPAWSARVLLSLTGVPLAVDEYVSAFELNTWSVRVLAVCRLPVGWTVTGGTYGDPGGILSGQARIGAAAVPRNDVRALRNLFLVEIGVDRPRAVDRPNGEHQPATFAGTATLGRYGHDEERTVPLSGRNLARTPAARCPDPAT